jgi:predicted dehydrogenase
MKNLIYGLVAVVAIGLSAFTTANNKRVIQAGIISTGTDGGGDFYMVEVYGTGGRACANEPNAKCSFRWDGSSLPSKVYANNPLIQSGSLVIDKEYH